MKAYPLSLGILCLAGIMLTGCSIPKINPPRQAYPGPARPDAEVARVRLCYFIQKAGKPCKLVLNSIECVGHENLIDELDLSSLKVGEDYWFSLIPGNYEISATRWYSLLRWYDPNGPINYELSAPQKYAPQAYGYTRRKEDYNTYWHEVYAANFKAGECYTLFGGYVLENTLAYTKWNIAEEE